MHAEREVRRTEKVRVAPVASGVGERVVVRLHLLERHPPIQAPGLQTQHISPRKAPEDVEGEAHLERKLELALALPRPLRVLARRSARTILPSLPADPTLRIPTVPVRPLRKPLLLFGQGGLAGEVKGAVLLVTRVGVEEDLPAVGVEEC